MQLKPPKVMAQTGEWPLLCKGLVEKGVCTVIPLDEVHHVQGSPLLNGMFAVGKGEYIGAVEAQRLIMNLTPVNRLVRELQGDISTLPCLSNFGLLTLGEKEELLVTSEDVRCFFYCSERLGPGASTWPSMKWCQMIWCLSP